LPAATSRKRALSPFQKVGGALAEMISQGSVPVLRKRCGIALVK
jgi:hypothetical protein